jgi:hypothetical protein
MCSEHNPQGSASATRLCLAAIVFSFSEPSPDRVPRPMALCSALALAYHKKSLKITIASFRMSKRREKLKIELLSHWISHVDVFHSSGLRPCFMFIAQRKTRKNRASEI